MRWFSSTSDIAIHWKVAALLLVVSLPVAASPLRNPANDANVRACMVLLADNI
jgi:hypothetical protein